jgi:hypothetical protein
MELTDAKFEGSLTSNIDNGGEKAADHLHEAIRSYLVNMSETFNDLKIFVKVYANVEGLSQALVREGNVRSVADFRLFVTEFTNRLPFCEFIDVGHGKERADNKIKGMSR